MRTKLKPCEANQISLALFHGTGENVQLGPSEHWTLQTLLILLTVSMFAVTKPGKDCFKCFSKVSVLITNPNGFRSHLFFGPKILLLSVQFEKNSFSNFCNVCIFKSQGPLISPVRQGPCGLNPALLGGFPQVSNSPSTSLLLCSENHHLPLPDCEFSLVYQKKIKQHHQMTAIDSILNGLRIFHFFVIHNNTIL